VARSERMPHHRRDTTWTDGRWHVRTEGEQAVVYDGDTGRCWQAQTRDLPRVVLADAVPLPSRVRPVVTLGVVVTTLGLLIGEVVAVTSDPTAGTGIDTAAVVVVSVAVHLALHEIAHIVVLRLLGRRSSGVGVKLDHVVFPAVYVRMTESLLLTRTDQALVHVAGLTVNVTVVAVTLGAAHVHPRLEVLTLGAQTVTLMACANAAPVLGSDGYRVLLALTGTPARRRLGENPPWLISLKLLGVLLAVLAGGRVVLALGHAVAPQLVPAPAELLPFGAELVHRAGSEHGAVPGEDSAWQGARRA